MLERLRSALADRYTIVRELGAGGMATVYLAEDRKHRRQVAVKVLRSELAAALGPERFLREIEIAARLHHPHILPLYDSGEADGFLYYVMPLVEGESLRSRLSREKQLPLDEALQIAREVADALSYAHSHNVVHRDIKPENILLDAGHAVVADFGIARAITAAGGERLTGTGITVGTPAYMSPEQAAGSNDLDGRSDLYSLGCVLYEMLAGQPPFAGPTVESVLRQHLTAEARSITQLRPAVPGEVAAALARALAKTPADRFNPVGQFAEALRQSGPSAGWSGRQRALARPRLRRWILAAAALGVVALLGLVTLLGRSAPDLLRLGRRSQVTLDPGLELDPALSPDGKLVAYVAGPLRMNKLFVRQVDGGAPIAVTSGPARFPFWAPDGRRILFQSPRGIEIVPALGGASRMLVPAVDGDPIPGGIAPDGRSFAFSARDSLFVRPLDGGAARFISAGRQMHSFAWSRDGRWIAYVAGNSAFVQGGVGTGNIAPSVVWVVPALGGTPVRVADDQSLNVSPAWVSERTLMYVSSRGGGRDVYQTLLTRSGLPVGPPLRVTTGLNPHGISISGDGSRFAYSAFSETSNVWSIAAAPAGAVSISQARPVTLGNQTIETFDVSPDGQWLAFDSNRGGTQQIYRVRFGAGEPEQLTNGTEDAFWPTWSPDGREIAFHSVREGHRHVFVLPAEGGEALQVTKGPHDELAPAWSHDGRHLLMDAGEGTNARIDIIARGADRGWSMPKQLAPVIGSDTVPIYTGAWSPDGRVVCATTRNVGLVLVPTGGGPARHLVLRSPTEWVGYPQWSADGRLVYYMFADSTGYSVRAVPASGGTSRVAVRFDDPTRPWHRFGFRVRGGMIYFTLGDVQSDIWVADVERK